MVFIPAGQTEVEIKVAGDIVTFIFPPYSDEEFGKKIETLLSSRFEFKGKSRRLIDKQSTARIKFFDDTCVDVKGLTMDEEGKKPLNASTPAAEIKKAYNTENWKKIINPSWKTTVAQYFEEGILADEEDIDEE